MITTTATASIDRHSGAAAWGAVGLFASVAVILVAAALAAKPHPPLNAVFQGSTADIGQYPWMASLRFDGQHNCGAVVVTDRMLLTAAHCVASYPKSHLSVIIGTDKPDWGHSTPISVADTYIEPGYVAPGASHDVAVIALDRRVSSPTATLMLDAAPPVGASAEIIGWGCTLDPQVGKAACGELAAQPPSLQAGWMKIVDNRLCHHFLPAYSDATHLCLNAADTAANAGDSGGPLLVRRDRAWIVAGIASLADFEQPALYNAYTSLHAEHTWVTSVITAAPPAHPTGSATQPTAGPAPTSTTTVAATTTTPPSPTTEPARRAPAPPPAPAPTTPTAPPTPDRATITSYDEMRPGAPYWGRASYGWQQFTAASNTLTFAAVTWGSQAPGISGATTHIQICQSLGPPTTSAIPCQGELANMTAPVTNYGASGGALGEIPVTPGATYFLVYYQPDVAAGTWDLYWWNGAGPPGRSPISTSDQMQAVIKGHNQ